MNIEKNSEEKVAKVSLIKAIELPYGAGGKLSNTDSYEPSEWSNSSQGFSYSSFNDLMQS